jgi:hypothetical protein
LLPEPILNKLRVAGNFISPATGNVVHVELNNLSLWNQLGQCFGCAAYFSQLDVDGLGAHRLGVRFYSKSGSAESGFRTSTLDFAGFV